MIPNKLALARLSACKRAPFLRSGFMSLLPQEAPGLGTLATSAQWVLYFDPAFVERESDDTLVMALTHELLHLTLDHHGRAIAIGAEPSVWNNAADASISEILRSFGYILPAWHVTPQSLGLTPGGTTESYYDALMQKQSQKDAQQKSSQDNNQNNNQQKTQSNQSTAGQNSPQAQSTPQDDATDAQSNQPMPGQGQASEPAKTQSKPGQGHCGSCAGNAHPDEQKFTPEHVRSQAEQKRTIKKMAQELQEHQSKNPGSVAGELARWVEKTLALPKVDWRKQLATLVRNCVAYRQGAVTSNYSAPSRRQAGLGYGVGRPTLAKLVAPKARVAVALDTSSSMGAKELEAAMIEIEAIVKAAGALVDFVACDTKVSKVTSIQNWMQAKKHVIGGGGTNFCPIFEAFNKRKPRPDILIILTDGYGAAPVKAPAYKTIWGIMNGRAPVSWGSVVTVE